MGEKRNISTERLAEIYKQLNKQGKILLMSNANTLLIQKQMLEANKESENVD